MATRTQAAGGLIDTSVFIAAEVGRPLGEVPPPSAAAVSVATLAELQLGILMADDPGVRAARTRTLASVQSLFQPLAIDRVVAGAFADLFAQARRAGRRPGVMDTWIAATALTHGLALYTQDADFLQFAGVHVIMV